MKIDIENNALSQLLCLLVPMLFLSHIAWYFNLAGLNGAFLAIFAIATLYTSYLAVCSQSNSKTALASTAFIILLVAYTILRWRLSDFSFSVGDASAYTWDGVYFSEFRKDSGFFPPLAASIAALGFEFFGLEKIALIFVFYAFLTLPLVYILLTSVRIDPWLALIALLFLAFAPLHIWFSKSTFSESIWQVLIISGMAGMALFNTRSKSTIFLSLLPVALIVLVSVFGRGTAVFFAAAMVTALYGIENFHWRGRLGVVTGVVATFLFAFWVSLEIRAPYLIGWQYSQIINGITSLRLFALIGSCFLFSMAVLTFLDFWLGKKRPILLRGLIVAGLVLMKVAFSIILSGRHDQGFYDLFILNELLYAKSTFSNFGIALLVLGFFYILFNGIKRGGGTYIVVIFYLLFSIPLALQSVGVKMGHEVLMYWHRYYFSELFLLSFIVIAIVLGQISIRLGNAISHENNSRLVALCIFTAAFFVAQNYSHFKNVQSNAYLAGSAKLVEWIKYASHGQAVYLYLDSHIHYGGYNAAFLLREISRYGVNVKGITVDAPPKRLPTNAVIICSVKYKCASSIDGDLISQHSSMVSWSQHSFDPQKTHERTISFNLKAFYSRPKFDVGSAFNISKHSEFLNENGVFESGWYKIEDIHVWSSEKAVVNLKKTMFANGKWPNLLKLDIAPYAASKDRPVKVEAHVGGRRLEFVYTDSARNTIEVPIACQPNEEQCRIEFVVENAISPKILGHSSDPRVLGFGLFSFSFE